jgi:thymidylate kinase
MHTLLIHVFEQLARANISYCLLRGYEELDEAAEGGDVDLLVAQADGARMWALLDRLEFVHLPSWGRMPHQFYIAYDESSDRWLKLDIVTEVTYGKPIPSVRTDLAATCLARRQPRGPTFTPAPEAELVTLLLHCVLDKGMIAANRSARLAQLRHEVADEAYLNRLLGTYWGPGMSWACLAQLIERAAWAELLAQRLKVLQHLARGQQLHAFARSVGGRVLRKLDRVAGALQPRSLSVALLAPDGGGKTTLANQLTKTFYLPSRYIYMGTNIEASTVGLPTTRWIAANAARPARSSGLPTWLAARGLRFVNNVFEQWYRYGTSYYHLIRGRLVLFDRYVYDSPASTQSTRSLKSRLRRWLLHGAAPKPNLVVYLDAPGEVLYARKGEHSPAVLEQQRQHYLGLQKHLPQMVVVDATSDADKVRRRVTALIWRGYASHLRRAWSAELGAASRGEG